MTASTTNTLGIDLGDRTSLFCEISSSGEVLRASSCPTTRAGFRKVFSDGARRVVLECGTHSPWASELLHELGHEVIVANPRKVQLIAQGRRKSDRKDAELLARLGRADASLLSPIVHRGVQARHDLALIRSRAALVRARTLLVNHIRGVVKSSGARLPSCSSSAFAQKVLSLIPESLGQALKPVVEQIGELSAKIKAMYRVIEVELPVRYPEMAHLRQVPGVGPITSATYVLTLESPARFMRSRHAAAFIGLTPARHQTGQSDPEMHISKTGDKLLRCMLVECAQYILSSRSPDSTLKRFGLRLAARGRKAAKKRAVIAVARKLATLLCALWRSGDAYVPFSDTASRSAA